MRVKPAMTKRENLSLFNTPFIKIWGTGISRLSTIVDKRDYNIQVGITEYHLYKNGETQINKAVDSMDLRDVAILAIDEISFKSGHKFNNMRYTQYRRNKPHPFFAG